MSTFLYTIVRDLNTTDATDNVLAPGLANIAVHWGKATNNIPDAEDKYYAAWAGDVLLEECDDCTQMYLSITDMNCTTGAVEEYKSEMSESEKSESEAVASSEAAASEAANNANVNGTDSTGVSNGNSTTTGAAFLAASAALLLALQ